MIQGVPCQEGHEKTIYFSSQKCNHVFENRSTKMISDIFFFNKAFQIFWHKYSVMFIIKSSMIFSRVHMTLWPAMLVGPHTRFFCPRRNTIPTRTIIRGGWVSLLLLSSSLLGTLLKMGLLLNAFTDLLHIWREVVLGWTSLHPTCMLCSNPPNRPNQPTREKCA